MRHPQWLVCPLDNPISYRALLYTMSCDIHAPCPVMAAICASCSSFHRAFLACRLDSCSCSTSAFRFLNLRSNEIVDVGTHPANEWGSSLFIVHWGTTWVVMEKGI